MTKVPIAGIRPFIETFTRPGELVVDLFAGSGMTGLAAVTLQRFAKLGDISVLGKHIAEGYLTDVSEDVLIKHAADVTARAKAAIGTMYETRRTSDDAFVEMVRTVWSFQYRCPACEKEVVYYEHLDDREKSPETCSSCGIAFVRRAWSRLPGVPVQVIVNGTSGRQQEQTVTEDDRARIAQATILDVVGEYVSEYVFRLARMKTADVASGGRPMVRTGHGLT
ncbi:MAG: hypothetical protein IJ131_07405 [Eggerthellaceae bacterium]|nr:hypothetical protein [Eggerthellaceae bacterium]